MLNLTHTHARAHAHTQIKAEKNGSKDRRALYKLMNNAIYGKTTGNLRNKEDVKFVSNKKGYLKWTLKPSYMPQKIFNDYLMAIRKNKVTLTLNKAAYARMCMLYFSKALIYEFHYDGIKNKYGNN